MNSDPYNFGWIVKVKVSNDSGMDTLLKYEEYKKQCSESA
ncbi:MAG: hypothetical protein VYB72_13180 [Planctomycetota bacterium]|nr:hypothetical protein [Planctomycetota bacterium]